MSTFYVPHTKRDARNSVRRHGLLEMNSDRLERNIEEDEREMTKGNLREERMMMMKKRKMMTMKQMKYSTGRSFLLNDQKGTIDRKR